MSYEENVKRIIEYLGGIGNIVGVSNCMTRLRVVVRTESKVNKSGLKDLPDVMGLVHDREGFYEIVVGPGVCKKYADICHSMGIIAGGSNGTYNTPDKGKKSLKSYLKIFGDIFVPLIPGVISAGLCAGFASLITQLVPDYANNGAWNLVYTVLSLVNTSFMTYMTAWVGYRSAERFGATPILGGMLGLITSLDGINTLAQIIGLYNQDSPLDSILHTGKGGVLAVIFGVLLLSKIEKLIRSHMPESVDIVFTPFLTVLICIVPYILVIMPLFGYISSGIAWVFGAICMSENMIVRILVGFVSSTVFLPLVASGMHHGLVALYAIQLHNLGFVTLYPAFAMAGAGQVGASLAIYRKATKVGNKRLCSVIKGALPAGFLGVGEPLIYGVTLPLGKPFITAGIGAGFGGALVMAMSVASTTWGPSGLIGAFVMTAGPLGAVSSVTFYIAGLVISYIASFIITSLTLRENDLQPEDAGEQEENAAAEGQPEKEYRHVHHGEEISFGDVFFYSVKDPLGIHARPAGKLVVAAKKYNARVSIKANGKEADAASLSELLKLGAVCGTKLEVSAEGSDAREAIREMESVIRKEL